MLQGNKGEVHLPAMIKVIFDLQRVLMCFQRRDQNYCKHQKNLHYMLVLTDMYINKFIDTHLHERVKLQMCFFPSSTHVHVSCTSLHVVCI